MHNEREDNSLLTRYWQATKADLAHAEALPFEVYSDPAVYALERQYAFHHEWVFACAEQQLAEPGCYFAFSLAGEPVLILRGEDAVVRAFSNICRHRGTPLVEEGFGQIEKHIVCPYHAWTYSIAGELKAVPFAKRIAVDKSEHRLHAYELRAWKGLLFVNLTGEAGDFETRMDALDACVSAYSLERFQHGHTGQREHWSANWKLAVENAIESYHLFKVHAQTLETLTPTQHSFYLGGSSEWSLSAGKFQDAPGLLKRLFGGDAHVTQTHYTLVFLPPGFIGILDAESFSWINVLPVGETSCEVWSGGVSLHGGTLPKAESDFNQAFLAEDKAIVERVQKGMSARFVQGGKLVDMEEILVDFRRFLATRIFDEPVSDWRTSAEGRDFLKQLGAGDS